MATIKRFEDIQAWQKARVLVREIYKLSRAGLLRNDFELRRQMCGAAVSSMSNIAEGFAKQGRSAAEFKRYLQMAMGSSDEMRVWARYCLDLGHIDEPTWQRWRDEYHSISKMLQGLARKWRIR